jgi:hypothetical protein
MQTWIPCAARPSNWMIDWAEGRCYTSCYRNTPDAIMSGVFWLVGTAGFEPATLRL